MFTWWWVLRLWVWLRVLWYVVFSLSLWLLRWLCQWRGIWNFCSDRSWFQLWRCYVCRVCTHRSRVQRWSTHRNILAIKFLIFPPHFKISFVTIVLVWPCLTYSDHCRFTKNIIWCHTMGSIRRPSNTDSRSTKDAAFIQCVDGQEPQIHKLWCLGLENSTQEFHPTVWVEDVAGTVGEFMTNYLDENGRRIPIIGKISINNSVHFLAFLTLSGGVDCHFFPTLKLSLIPQAG